MEVNETKRIFLAHSAVPRSSAMLEHKTAGKVIVLKLRLDGEREAAVNPQLPSTDARNFGFFRAEMYV